MAVSEPRKTNNFARLMRRIIICSRDDGSTGGCHNEGRIEHSFALLVCAERKASFGQACQSSLTGECHGRDSEKVFSQNLWEDRLGREAFISFHQEQSPIDTSSRHRDARHGPFGFFVNDHDRFRCKDTVREPTRTGRCLLPNIPAGAQAALQGQAGCPRSVLTEP